MKKKDNDNKKKEWYLERKKERKKETKTERKGK